MIYRFGAIKHVVNFLINIMHQVKSFYGLSNEISSKQLFVRKDIVIGKTSKWFKDAKTESTSQVGKSVYFIGEAARDAIGADRDRRLKVVAAGMKVLERKTTASGGVEYRLVQEGIHLMAPYLSGRKVNVTVQDFCNILGAGLVSFSTLSPDTVNAIASQPVGVLICIYSYDVKDRLNEEEVSHDVSHNFYALCWKGGSRTLNVACNKIGELISLHEHGI